MNGFNQVIKAGQKEGTIEIATSRIMFAQK